MIKANEVVVLLIVIFFTGFGAIIGYNEGKKVPCEDIVLEEIIELQKDGLKREATIAMLLIQMAYLEEWKNKTYNMTEADKELIRESIKTQKEELKNGHK